jgi:hypothetical protein
LAAAALALGLGCGNSDNRVTGGIRAVRGQPSVLLDQVGSAIHGPATATDARGRTFPSNAVLLSDRDGLCADLEAHPDLFRNPTGAFAALLFLSPPHEVGTYYVGQTGSDIAVFAATGTGQVVFAWPAATGGSVSLAALSSAPGGQASGSFSFSVVDAAGRLDPIYGQFLTSRCAALADAYLPTFQ